MNVRSFTYSRYHGKNDVGSSRLRVHQLQKYWSDYKEYKYGELPDVLVFQKVYMQSDWKWIAKMPCIKILDICDPDWLEAQHIKETVDAVDGVTCPTQPMADFIRQLTDKPIKVIPDRHDISNVPPLKEHKGTLQKVVWFGYRHNADLLKNAVPVLERMNIHLTVYSNDDPFVQQWATPNWAKYYKYKKFNEETIITDLRKFDACLLPQGNRPQDRFKSNNKTTLAWLAGLPVITDADTMQYMMLPEARNDIAKRCYNKAISEFDVKLSIKEMQEFINELSSK